MSTRGAQRRLNSHPEQVGPGSQPPESIRWLVRVRAPEAGSGFLSRADEPSRWFPGTNSLTDPLKTHSQRSAGLRHFKHGRIQAPASSQAAQTFLRERPQAVAEAGAWPPMKSVPQHGAACLWEAPRPPGCALRNFRAGLPPAGAGGRTPGLIATQPPSPAAERHGSLRRRPKGHCAEPHARVRASSPPGGPTRSRLRRAWGLSVRLSKYTAVPAGGFGLRCGVSRGTGGYTEKHVGVNIP